MRGVILAGGKGTRLWPLTAVTNKNLIPVGDIPMIEYPLYTLRNSGVSKISVVTGGEHLEQISKYLGQIHKNINFSYYSQLEAGGISQAIACAKDSLEGGKVTVILGDNIFEDDFSAAVKKFEKSKLGAMLFLKEVDDPERFGVAEIKDNKIVSIKEKPKKPKSNLAVTGFYLYDSTVFDKIKTLKPSARGELEVTDLNNLYINERRLGYSIVTGFWSDAGTHESRSYCEKFVKKGLESKVIKASPGLVLK